MRRIIGILVALLIVSVSGQALAQSLDWEKDPSMRPGLEQTPKGEDMPLFGPYMDGTGEGILEHLDGLHKAEREKHLNHNHWYEEDCCSGQDCKPYATKHIIVNIDGSISVYFNMRWLLVQKDQIKARPPNATHDEFWHVCINADEVHDPYALCAYPPDISS